MNASVKERTNDSSIPETPRNLIYLALLFVPGVYIVLLLSAALVIGVGGGLIYGAIKLMGEAHRANGKIIFLIIALGFGVLVGTYAVIKGVISAIWRKPGFEPAMLIPLAREPKLREFIGNICWPMGSTLPTSVILHAEPTAFVMQGKLNTFNGAASGRILCIGVPLLSALTVNELRAVLAHEFGHFTGNDTVYSAKVLPVYLGASTAFSEMHEAIAQNAAEEGSFWTRVPMFIPRSFLYLYLTIFHLLDMRISRLMEKRADHIAANCSGSKSFCNGLKKVVGLSGVYDDEVIPGLIKGIGEGKKSENIFGTIRAGLPNYVAPAKAFVDKVMAQPEDPHDSHPALKTRMEYIPSVEEKFEDNTTAAMLFDNLEQYEKELTQNFTELLAMVKAHNEAMEKAMAEAQAQA